MGFKVNFPVSGVTTWIFLPPVVTALLAYFGAMAGVTGAFLLLPFQMSILDYNAPGVSATNFLYNLFAIPGTVWRYLREGRLNWPLAICITLGSFPGIGLGYYFRIRWLSDPRSFKPFAGLVLLYLAYRLGRDLISGRRPRRPPKEARLKTVSWSLSKVTFEFDGKNYTFSPLEVAGVSFLVGIAGGAYGIGGGAVLSPYCVAVLRLPVHTVDGASLFGTWVSSLVGVLIYSTGWGAPGLDTRPDFLLGALFGLGGIIGGYLGARTQKFVPEYPIKLGLFFLVLIVALRYLMIAFR
jgi:uncharacterized membrane protein YfcA